MIIQNAAFVVSNTNPSACPVPDKPEFAFIGRSNVGKSSLINMLVNRKNLAKTSSTPGKTQTINHFIVNDTWYLVDLPGYGYASVSRSKSYAWGGMIETYLRKRENLATTFVLIDTRLEPQKIDLEFIHWIGTEHLPFAMVFTKADKISRKQTSVTIEFWKKKLRNTWEELPPIFVTSAVERQGKDELLRYIDEVLASSD